MAVYRYLRISAAVARDSSLTQPLFGPEEAAMYQALDQEAHISHERIGPADSETTIALRVTTGYSLTLLSDYPIRVRLNGAAATQFTLTSSNVRPVAVGAPPPYNCALIMTGTITELRLQPISGASTTANVTIVVTGDPTNSYT